MYKKYYFVALMALFFITLNTSCDDKLETKEFPPYFTTSSSYFTSDEITVLTFNAEGLNTAGKNESDIGLVTTVPWEAKSNADWLKISHTSGKYNTNIKVSVLKNTGTSARSSTIILTPEAGNSLTITVTQSGNAVGL